MHKYSANIDFRGMLRIVVIFGLFCRFISCRLQSFSISVHNNDFTYSFSVKAISFVSYSVSTKVRLFYAENLESYPEFRENDGIIRNFLVLDPGRGKDISYICDKALKNVPVIILSSYKRHLNEGEIVKYIYEFKRNLKFSFIGIINERESEIFRNCLKKGTTYTSTASLDPESVIKVDFILYLILTSMFWAIFFVIYAIVCVFSEKEPICIPKVLEKCSLVEYKNIPNKEYCTRCIICLDDFNGTDVCRLLGCKHFFHSRCVDTWLQNKSSKCPLCNRYLNVNFYK